MLSALMSMGVSLLVLSVMFVMATMSNLRVPSDLIAYATNLMITFGITGLVLMGVTPVAFIRQEEAIETIKAKYLDEWD